MIRRTAGLALALGTATLLWTPGAAQAQCRDLRVATNCTYQDGTCIRGGGAPRSLTSRPPGRAW